MQRFGGHDRPNVLRVPSSCISDDAKTDWSATRERTEAPAPLRLSSAAASSHAGIPDGGVTNAKAL
ncbi:hypothetical protein CGRA01v4_03612 [Colletotrichum graminicola]|nr:hypothetical protein CGRA01v4_03612 [Colletotrichum graminicola]